MCYASRKHSQVLRRGHIYSERHADVVVDVLGKLELDGDDRVRLRHLELS